jgi:hypothetical protein
VDSAAEDSAENKSGLVSGTSVAFQCWFPMGAGSHQNVPLVPLSIPVTAAENGDSSNPFQGEHD